MKTMIFVYENTVDIHNKTKTVFKVVKLWVTNVTQMFISKN